MTKNFQIKWCTKVQHKALKGGDENKKCHQSKKYQRQYIENFIKKTKKSCMKICKTAVQIDLFHFVTL